MELLVASTNPHKLREFAQILAPHGVVVRGLDDGVALPPPNEDAETFLGNARIKAVTYARAVRQLCLADDSGLEVDGLGGAPGVRSARYAGVGGSRDERDRANNTKLIAELTARPLAARSARLVCALCVADELGNVLFETCASLAGEIVDDARGGHGFGYDTHLWLLDVGKTAAELSPLELNERSHRGKASRALLQWLELRGWLSSV